MKKKKIHVPIILLLFILLLLMLLLFLSTSQLACLKWNVNSNNFTYFIWRNTFFFLSLGWSLARSLFLWKKYLNRQNDIFHHVNSSSIWCHHRHPTHFGVNRTVHQKICVYFRFCAIIIIIIIIIVVAFDLAFFFIST